MAETMERSFPFDSEEVNGKPDRVYVAEDFTRYFSTFISSGIFLEDSTNLQVLANGDMTVTYKKGDAIIDGTRYWNPTDIIIQLDPADGVMDRIDRISFTWIREERDVHYTVQKGELSFSPKPPACRRTAEYKDYVVADVYVRAGAISIGQKDITDQRLNSEVCGLAVAFSEIDTTTIFLQFTEWFNYVRKQGELDIDTLIAELTADWTDEILKWFNVMKGQLSEDAACNLQNQIYSINAVLREISEKEIDDIINGTYEDTGEGGIEPDAYSKILPGELENIVNKAFSLDEGVEVS